jgi:hypothetical protein
VLYALRAAVRAARRMASEFIGARCLRERLHATRRALNRRRQQGVKQVLGDALGSSRAHSVALAALGDPKFCKAQNNARHCEHFISSVHGKNKKNFG